MTTATGILAHGDNHFIVSRPMAAPDVARALVRHWSLIRIGVAIPPDLEQWRIVTRAFRENLEWAVVVESNDELSPAVRQLLRELSARGVAVHRISSSDHLPLRQG